MQRSAGKRWDGAIVRTGKRSRTLLSDAAVLRRTALLHVGRIDRDVPQPRPNRVDFLFAPFLGTAIFSVPSSGGIPDAIVTPDLSRAETVLWPSFLPDGQRFIDDSSPGHSLRGTRTGRQRRGEEGACAQDDPRTAKPWLQRRTSPDCIERPGMIARGFSTLVTWASRPGIAVVLARSCPRCLHNAGRNQRIRASASERAKPLTV